MIDTKYLKRVKFIHDKTLKRIIKSVTASKSNLINEKVGFNNISFLAKLIHKENKIKMDNG